MEYSLGSVGTIVRIAQDITAAVATVNRNKSRCKKLQKRVQGISDVLRDAGATTAATQRLLDRLQDALARALRLVKLCKGRSCPINFIAGRRVADQFDELDGEIDRCLLDLGAANHVTIARLEKQLHQNMAGSTETVTLRIGMPCDDSAEKIKHCISTMQGVTEVAAGAASKDQFMVTVRSGDVDIPSLLDQAKQKLNRNVELITPAAPAKDAMGAGVKNNVVKDHDRKANRKSEGNEDRSDRQRRSSRSASGAETKEEKAAANMVGLNQQAPGPFVYLPFKVEFVPVGDASSMYPAPTQHGFMAHAYAAPGGVPVHVQRQSNLHRVHFKDASVNNYDSGCYTKDATMKKADEDENKGKVANDCGVDKDEKKGKVAGDGEWKDRDNITGSLTAIGVPVHGHHRGMPELVPPPSYGHGYWPYAADCRSTGGCCHHNAGGPADGAAAHGYNHHSPYPDYFSDENPNACSIM